MYLSNIFSTPKDIKWVEKEVVGENKNVAFLTRWNIIKLTEPNTPLNNADHVGSFLFDGKYDYVLIYYEKRIGRSRYNVMQ